MLIVKVFGVQCDRCRAKGYAKGRTGLAVFDGWHMMAGDGLLPLAQALSNGGDALDTQAPTFCPECSPKMADQIEQIRRKKGDDQFATL